MTTLISAEGYKLLHGKVLALILAGVAAQTLVFKVFILTTDIPPAPGQTGVLFVADSAIFLQVWLIAFVGFFVASEFQNGTIRNILALGKNRTHVYLFKLLASFVAIAAIFAAVSIVSTAWLSVRYGFGDMPFNEFRRFFTWNFSMQLLYHLPFAAVFTMFAFLSRSLGMTILLGVGSWIAKSFLPDVLRALDIGFAIEYLPDYYIDMFGEFSGDPAFITKGMIVSVAYVVIASIIGWIVFKKSDIK